VKPLSIFIVLSFLVLSTSVISADDSFFSTQTIKNIYSSFFSSSQDKQVIDPGVSTRCLNSGTKETTKRINDTHVQKNLLMGGEVYAFPDCTTQEEADNLMESPFFNPVIKYGEEADDPDHVNIRRITYNTTHNYTFYLENITKEGRNVAFSTPINIKRVRNGTSKKEGGTNVVLRPGEVMIKNVQLTDKIHLGDNSTTIILQIANSENLDDVWLDEDQADTNLGNNGIMILQKSAGSDSRILIKFNNTLPINTTILDARLTLYAYDNRLDSGEGFDVTSYILLNNFTETEPTYNNFTINETNINLTPFNSESFTDSFPVVGPWSHNVTQIVQSFSNNGKEFNIFINSSNPIGSAGANDDLLFRSKEGSSPDERPILNITYQEAAGPVLTNVSFVSPTPPNNTAQFSSNASVQVNVSIYESDLSNLTYAWNRTNFTLYDDSLLLMYNFDNRSILGENDSYVVDLSGNDKDGTWYGDATPDGDSGPNLGKYDGGFEFDGTGDYLGIPNAGGIAGVQSGTISMWVKWQGTQDAGVTGYGHVFGRQEDGVLTNQVIALSGSNPATAKVVWYPYNPSASVTSSSSPGDGDWRQVTIVYASGAHTMYIDGVFEGSATTTGTMHASTNHLLTIGAGIDDVGGYSTSVIDDLKFWNRPLSFNEINQLYMTSFTKYNEAYWNLYVNQTEDPSNLLSAGEYSYQVFTENSSGSENGSEERFVNIVVPSINITIVEYVPFSLNNVTYNDTFVVTANVSCSYTDCGDVELYLDPPVAGDTNIAPNGTMTLVDGTPAGGVVASVNDEDTGTAHSVYPTPIWHLNWTESKSVSTVFTYWGCTFFCLEPADLNISYWDTNALVWVNPVGWYNTSTLGIDSWHTHDLLLPIQTTALRITTNDEVGVGGAVDFGEINVSGGSGGGAKSGIISTETDAEPFWVTNSTNPINTTLTQDESKSVSWLVNATGPINNTYEIFAYGILQSNLFRNDTNSFNVTIVEATAPPADSCTYAGSGLHTYLCSDNCNITSLVQHDSDVNISGAGNFYGISNLNWTGVLTLNDDGVCTVNG